MKKIILTALVAVASLSASAQFYVGGALGFRSTKDGGEGAKSQSVFTLSPELGYDINENWTVGLDLDIQFANNKVGENFGGEVYGRYNYLKAGIATLFVELSAGYYSNKFNADDYSLDAVVEKSAQADAATEAATRADAEETKDESPKAAKCFNISLRPGVKIALSDKFSLVAKTGLIGYKKYTDKGPSEFNIGVDNDAIKLGVYYSF